jgi:hypothetical protein
MQSRAWQQKQLQAQLASWAELRRDTILYAKQSYMESTCEYPSGYVEPYPEFYARIRALTSDIARRIQAAPVPAGSDVAQWHKHIADFFTAFAATMKRLEDLAKKELASQPFTEEEQSFLKKTINPVSGGSGPPRYEGWYGDLYYREARREIEHFKPTIADVHTNASTNQVLEVGVGNINLLVIAVDNEKDRAVYVGPIHTYYEFASPTRMTDREWLHRLVGHKAPARPEWVNTFTGSMALPLAPVGAVQRRN